MTHPKLHHMEIKNRALLEEVEGWRHIERETPYIQFKENWQVKVTPPYLWAVARFRVKDISTGTECSVYLDWFNVLGYCGGRPYWEVHSFTSGEPERFELDDVIGVRDCIERKLEAANK